MDAKKTVSLREDRVALVVLGSLIVIGAVIRFLVARQDLFADELATYWIVSTRSLTDVVRTVATTAEISPPLSFILSWLTTRQSLDPLFVRLPALIAGIATIPLVYAIGMRTVGRGAALLATTLVTFSPFMIFYSAEARGYGVLMALCLLSTLSLLNAVEANDRSWWFVYAISVSLVAYTHYTGVFILGTQFVWAFATHASARKHLTIATVGAALTYIPWLTSLKGDLDSPTTLILDRISPFTWKSVETSVLHWTIGFPFALDWTELRDLPGVPALILLALGTALGIGSLLVNTRRLRPWFRSNRWRIVLVAALAVATPAGAAFQSAIGNNVFSTRSLASSLPYLALTFAAIITVGSRGVRATAAALTAVSFIIGGILVASMDAVQRPAFGEAAEIAAELPNSVIVDASSLSPGPLINSDVGEYASSTVPVFRLTSPAQKETPFSFRDIAPDPVDVTARAVAAADGGPIILMTTPLPHPFVAVFLDELPESYELTSTSLVRGILDIETRVFERPPES